MGNHMQASNRKIISIRGGTASMQFVPSYVPPASWSYRWRSVSSQNLRRVGYFARNGALSNQLLIRHIRRPLFVTSHLEIYENQQSETGSTTITASLINLLGVPCLSFHHILISIKAFFHPFYIISYYSSYFINSSVF
jgi:hypothetical protein